MTIIISYHKDGTAITIVRPANFNVQEWMDSNKENFRLLGIVRVESEKI